MDNQRQGIALRDHWDFSTNAEYAEMSVEVRPVEEGDDSRQSFLIFAVPARLIRGRSIQALLLLAEGPWHRKAGAVAEVIGQRVRPSAAGVGEWW